MIRTLHTLSVCAMLGAAFLSAPALRADSRTTAPAQGKAAAVPAAQTQTQTQAQVQAPAHGTASEGSVHEADHGAAAHHGPEVKLFGASLGPTGQWLVKLFNFSVFAGLLFFLLKGALSSAFKVRAQELRDQLAQAEREKAEAEAQARELEGRMEGLQQELASILEKAESEAQAEKARVIEAARVEADLILAQTRQEIASTQRQAELELRALVAELAVEGASERLKLRVSGDTAGRIVDHAIHHVGGAR